MKEKFAVQPELYVNSYFFRTLQIVHVVHSITRNIHTFS